jgi:hypothetical protein
MQNLQQKTRKTFQIYSHDLHNVTAQKCACWDAQLGLPEFWHSAISDLRAISPRLWTGQI